MKIGITNDVYYRTWGLTDYYKMREHGYDACDFQDMTEPEYALHTMSEREFEERLTAERKAAASCGICHYQVHCCEPKYDAESPVAVSNFEKIKRCVRATALLGSKYLAVHPVMPFGWGPEPDGEVVFAKNRAFFTALCEYAKEFDVTVCLENMPFPEHFISRIPDVADFVEKLGFENLGICFDTGHANILNDDCGEMVMRCGKNLKILHVHDNRKHSDDHSLPYQGNINWRGFTEALQKVRYNGCLSLEPSFNKDAPDNVRDVFQRFSIEMAKSII